MQLSRALRLDDLKAPELWSVEWAELCSAFRTFIRCEKLDAPGWSPGERPADAPDRKGFRVTQIWAGVIDLDDVTPAVFRAVVERLTSAGVCALVHSTHSNAAVWPTRVRARVIFPLSEPVPRQAWRGVWRAFVRRFAPEMDQTTKDPGRYYYVPCAPVDAPEESVFSVELPGSPWAPEHVPEVLAAAPASVRLTREDVERLARRLARASRSIAADRDASALLAITKGEPFADPGERDDTTFRLVRIIVEAEPRATPESIAELFATPLAVMGPDAPTQESVRLKAERARGYLATREDDPREDGPRVLVTPTGSTWYARNDEGRWVGPSTGDAIAPMLLAALEPAASRGEIQIREFTPKGPRLKSPPALLLELGERIDTARIVLGATHNVYDPSSGIFSEAAARPILRTPKYSARFDGFLRAFAAESYEDLKRWLALAPKLEEPIAALCLLGKRGAGKGLLAGVIASLWTDAGPAMAQSVFGSHNAEILRCPLIFADEALPKGVSVSGALREIVQARQHTIRRKYLPDTVAHGAVRLVIAANNEEILSLDERLGPEDIAAIQERFFIPCAGTPVEARFAAACEVSRLHAEQIVEEGPAHILWLSQNATIERRGRFWITDAPAPMSALVTQGGDRSDVILWIVRWMEKPQRLVDGKSFVDVDGEIHLSFNDILNRWDAYMPDVDRPRVQDLRVALRALSRNVKTQGLRHWPIDRSLVNAWIQNTGWTTGEAVTKKEPEEKDATH